MSERNSDGKDRLIAVLAMMLVFAITYVSMRAIRAVPEIADAVKQIAENMEKNK